MGKQASQNSHSEEMRRFIAPRDILSDYILPSDSHAGSIIEYLGDKPLTYEPSYASLRWYANMAGGPAPEPEKLLEIKRIKALEALSKKINDGGVTIWEQMWGSLKEMVRNAIDYWRS